MLGSKSSQLGLARGQCFAFSVYLSSSSLIKQVPFLSQRGPHPSQSLLPSILLSHIRWQGKQGKGQKRRCLDSVHPVPGNVPGSCTALSGEWANIVGNDSHTTAGFGEGQTSQSLLKKNKNCSPQSAPPVHMAQKAEAEKRAHAKKGFPWVAARPQLEREPEHRLTLIPGISSERVLRRTGLSKAVA